MGTNTSLPESSMQFHKVLIVMAVTIIFPIFHQTLSSKRSERPFDAEGLLIFFSFPFLLLFYFANSV